MRIYLYNISPEQMEKNKHKLDKYLVSSHNETEIFSSEGIYLIKNSKCFVLESDAKYKPIHIKNFIKGYSSEPVHLGTGVDDRGALISSRGQRSGVEEVNTDQEILVDFSEYKALPVSSQIPAKHISLPLTTNIYKIDKLSSILNLIVKGMYEKIDDNLMFIIHDYYFELSEIQNLYKTSSPNEILDLLEDTYIKKDIILFLDFILSK